MLTDADFLLPTSSGNGHKGDNPQQLHLTMVQRLELYRAKKSREKENQAAKARRQRPRWSSASGCSSSSVSSSSGGGGSGIARNSLGSSGSGSGSGSCSRGGRGRTSSLGSGGAGRASRSSCGSVSSLDRPDRPSPFSSSSTTVPDGSGGVKGGHRSDGGRGTGGPPRPPSLEKRFPAPPPSGSMPPSSKPKNSIGQHCSRGGAIVGVASKSPTVIGCVKTGRATIDGMRRSTGDRTKNTATSRSTSTRRKPLSVIQRGVAPEDAPSSDVEQKGNSSKLFGGACAESDGKNTTPSPKDNRSREGEVATPNRHTPLFQAVAAKAGISVSPLSSPEGSESAENVDIYDGIVQIPVMSTSTGRVAASQQATDGDNAPRIGVGDAAIMSTSPKEIIPPLSVHEQHVADVSYDTFPTENSKKAEMKPSEEVSGVEDENYGEVSHLHLDGLDSPPPEPKSITKKRRNTTLFDRPNSISEEKNENATRRRPPEAEQPASNGTSAEPKEADAGKDTKGPPDVIDQAIMSKDFDRLSSLCKLYHDEHAAVRFVVGILKLEKSDAEERVKTLSDAYEAKLLQNRSILAELTKLRKENAVLKQKAKEKQEETEKIIAALQMQMTTGLSTAIQKTKTLQMQLNTAKLERENLEKKLAALEI